MILLFYDKNKVKYAIYETKKCFEEKHVDLLLIGEEGKRHFVLIKDFNTFMHDYALNSERKHFCRYCLQALSTEKTLKSHAKDWLKINGYQTIKVPKKGEHVRFKNYERK